MLKILHLSDAHFSAQGMALDQLRIKDAVLGALREQEWEPDVCVFTGDISHSGAGAEFELATDWLAALVEPFKKTHLFVVPGNHDVSRAHIAPDFFLHRRRGDNLRRDDVNELAAKHMENFSRWHENLHTLLGERLLSKWTNPFGCSATLTVEDTQFGLLGLNTASHAIGDDTYDLVQDAETLRDARTALPAGIRIVAVGHHPLRMLAGWNRAEIEVLLSPDNGVGVYLHGHNHSQVGAKWIVTNGLASFGSGVLFEGSLCRQQFAIHNISAERQLETRVYSYASNAGAWVRDPASSTSSYSPDSAPETDATSTDDNSLEVRSKRWTEQFAFQAPEMWASRPALALHAHQARDLGHEVAPKIKNFIVKKMVPSAQLYSFVTRTKSVESILRKVTERRSAGNEAYGINDIPDIMGFRLVTLFQGDIPVVLGALLAALPEISTDYPSLRFSNIVEIRIVVPFDTPDSLPAVQELTELGSRFGIGDRVTIQQSSISAFSVVIVARLSILVRGETERVVLAEFQIRNALEDIWLELDHRLRYGSERGDFAEVEQILAGVRSQLAACSHFADSARRMLKGREPASEPLSLPDRVATGISRALSSPSEQLERLQNLPPGTRQQVENAYRLWVAADSAQQASDRAIRYRRAADAFGALLHPIKDITDSKLATRLLHVARMERAYLLALTGNRDEIHMAKSLYVTILNENPLDITARFRLGLVCAALGEIDESIGNLRKVVEAAENKTDPNSREAPHWIYDNARLTLAFQQFRKFENRDLTLSVRRQAIKEAIELSRRVADEKGEAWPRLMALNNLVYFAWAERSISSDASLWCVNDTEFASLSKFLAESDRAADRPEIQDTLMRAFDYLGIKERATYFATRVWQSLAARTGVDGEDDQIGPAPSSLSSLQRIARILEEVREPRERESIIYAANVTNKT
jgi:ppGpp synthetase/RelA/SpoT-type nucleotidyltranferase